MDLQAHVDAIFERPAGEGRSLAAVVLHRGVVVAERYGIRPANAFQPEAALDADTPVLSWSVAKSITHAALGVLVLDGAVDLHAPAPVREWAKTSRQTITMLDLLEMRSGLEFVEDYVDGGASHCLAMLFGEGADDHAGYAASQALLHEPGTVWNYSSGSTNILARIMGQVVGGGRDGMERFLHDRLFGPAGMSSASATFDPSGTFVGSSYVHATARDFARFGELYRHDGVTEAGERILPVGWSDHARHRIAHDPTDDLPHGFDYGRHWWMWPQFPGSLAGHGYDGQFVVVVPDRELTVAHFGLTPADVRRHLVRRLDDLIASVPVTA